MRGEIVLIHPIFITAIAPALSLYRKKREKIRRG
jgi:hypothetical protein